MEALQYLKRVDVRLSKVIDSIGEIETMTYSQSLNSYAFLVKEIVGQMISSKVKGIGVWTSKMYLIFFLKRKDVLPYEDVAFIQAFKWLYDSNEATSESIKNTCEKWKPYSSIGALYMYRALDSGLTKIPINVF